MCSLNEACLSRSSGSLANTTITTMGMLMAIAAMPYTVTQPKAWASGGATSTDTAVPTLPAPTRPMARPLCLAGNEPEPKRQRHAKAGTGNAQQHAHGQQVVEGLDEEEAKQHGHHDQAHLDQRGVFAADVLRQDAQAESASAPRQ